MLIHRVHEGEKLYLGLNWSSNKMTFINFKFLLPIYLYYSKNYFDFDSCNIYKGLRISTFFFSFRIRRWKNFSSRVKKITCYFNFGTRPIGKQQCIMTEETLADFVTQ